MSYLIAIITLIRIFFSDGTTQDVVVPTTTTTLAYHTVYTGGYLGSYDLNTITAWPPKVLIMQGEANVTGPLVATARQRAVATGNVNAKFLFYLSLTDMDSSCSCYDQQFYDSFKTSRPEWILKDSSGNKVSTNNGIGRVFATDIGNPLYTDAWLAWARAAMSKYGWDGVWADNVIRCNGFGEWSALPINPRTRAVYTCSDYRRDIGNALAKFRSVLHAENHILFGNHSGAWHVDSFSDPLIQQQITLMDGVRVEDCVYDYSGNPHSEQEWIEQLAYASYANNMNVTVQCEGASGTIATVGKRDYVLATELLTKERFSGVAELNTVTAWWSGLDIDLGQPLGYYECIAPTGVINTKCSTLGDTYRRRWSKGVVVVNPTSITRTIPLGQTTVNCGTSISLAPKTGKVCI